MSKKVHSLSAVQNPNSFDETASSTEFLVDTDGTLTAGSDAIKGFAATTYTGNGSTQNIITGVDMSTGDNGGFVWTKQRNFGYDHNLQDSIRGFGETLHSSSTDIESTDSNSITSVIGNGFSLGTDITFNGVGDTYIAWSFQTTAKASGTTSSGKPYTAHYNEAMGFSVVGYEGNGTTGHSIPHKLLAPPEIIVTKNRDTVIDWLVSGVIFKQEGNYLDLNQDEPLSFSASIKHPTSSDIVLDSSPFINENTSDHIAYCFRSVPNFSKIKTYIGTGVSGNQVDLGLDMTIAGSFVMIKRLDSAGSWRMLDNTRDSNPVTEYLSADSSGVEASFSLGIDFTTTGAEVNDTSGHLNALGGEYLIMAFTPNYASTGQHKIPSVPTTAEVNANLPITWEGTAFIDPMAVGANPTAKIYPDGSIVGSTANGSYTRYPNGDLECSCKSTALTCNITNGSLFEQFEDGTFPIRFIGSLPVVASGALFAVGKVFPGMTAGLALNVFSFHLNSATSGHVGFATILAKGRWK